MPTLKKLLVVEIVISLYSNRRLEGDGSSARTSADASGGKNHPKMYKHDCQFCEKKIESRASKQKYCSHKCYIHDRFWRQEDAEEVIGLLRKGIYPEKVPKWIKDMLLGESEQIP